MNAFGQLMIFWAAISLLAMLIGLWITYAVLKAAIRDGINESRLGDKWTREVERHRHETTGNTPPIRAD